MPWAHAYENLVATSSLLAIFLAKKEAMSESDILIDRVSDYVSEFKPIIDEWHTQIYCMESNLNGAIVHDHIFQKLVKFIMKLDNEIPTLLPSPVAPSPSNALTPGAPSHTRAPPMAGPPHRHSLRLSTMAG
ncbi:hypothetical protein P692DRAFT_20881541 [Suillus brevipes Sb2]|nr:hypothetical protein P692DRAFT_20881541 [Suillus brevipes Sb2]